MRPRRLMARIGTLAVALLVSIPIVGSGRAGAGWRRPRPAVGPPKPPAQVGVHQVIIDGHCELVDAQGVPLYDPLYRERTGHDPC